MLDAEVANGQAATLPLRHHPPPERPIAVIGPSCQSYALPVELPGAAYHGTQDVVGRREAKIEEKGPEGMAGSTAAIDHLL
jgi:hypothetical protein